MTTERKKFGEILVANGTISQKTLLRALERAQLGRKRIGETLEEMGVATGDEIAATLAEQFRCKIARNFAGYSYAAELLKIISVDTVTQHFLFPLRLDKNNLYLAMADPTATKIVSNIAKNNDLTIIPYIASRGDIVAAIKKHYLSQESNSDKRPTVLVVEDNLLLATELGAVLTREGYRVVAARDGIEAFRKAVAESPDVIVTDKEMPILDGYRLFDSLKAHPETTRIPVLLLTSSQNGNEESDAFAKGFFDFIAKPVKEVTLVTRVKRALQHFPGAR